MPLELKEIMSSETILSQKRDIKNYKYLQKYVCLMEVLKVPSEKNNKSNWKKLPK